MTTTVASGQSVGTVTYPKLIIGPIKMDGPVIAQTDLLLVQYLELYIAVAVSLHCKNILHLNI
jgi:hypothetical protein